MIGRPMRFQGRSAVVDLEYEDVVRIRLRDRDVEDVAARFFTAAAAFSLSAAR
jgi:hypothetical protein